jgi:hypothetical protein
MRIGRSASLTSGPILSTTSKYQIQNILTKQIRVKKTNQTNQFDWTMETIKTGYIGGSAIVRKK